MLTVGHAELVRRISGTKDYYSCVLAALAGAGSVLEPGCGFGWNLARLPRDVRRVGVEVNAKKLADPRCNEARQAGVELVQSFAQPYLDATPDGAFEVVLLVDFVEHFSPEDGKRILASAKRIAAKRVVLWGPLGFHPQDYDEWGTDGAQWETHRWTINAGDLEAEGLTEILWPNYHSPINARRQPRDSGAMWGIFSKE